MVKMAIFPGESELLSLFGCEPVLLDTTSKDLPFYYNKAKYQFSNGEEDFIVTLCPSIGEVKIQVTQCISNRLLFHLELKRVDKFEITVDTEAHSSVLLIVVNDGSQQMIEIDFKPYFKQIFKEHFTR
jgi:hypothetical protein